MALTQINNLLAESIPRITSVLIDILEIVVESHPEAVVRIDERRNELRRQYEEGQQHKDSAAAIIEDMSIVEDTQHDD